MKKKLVTGEEMPKIVIERIITGTDGLQYLDVYDENSGYAYFLKVVDKHKKGMY